MTNTLVILFVYRDSKLRKYKHILNPIKTTHI